MSAKEFLNDTYRLSKEPFSSEDMIFFAEAYAKQQGEVPTDESVGKSLMKLFLELNDNAYNSEYHNYYYKETNQVVRAFFEKQLRQSAEQQKRIDVLEHLLKDH